MIALIDCNNFYCSCERLFKPSIRSRPVGVLSNNDGCFISRSNELKKLGVPMGAPYFKVKDVCDRHNVQVFSANFSLYTNLSSRVMSLLTDFSPEVEVYSIDEAFLNLSGIKTSSWHEYAKAMKARVERNTGIPVSVGIAKTKVLAKLANHFAKKKTKAGVCVLDSEESTDQLLRSMPIDEVWGINKKTKTKMYRYNITTAYHLKTFTDEALIKRVFTIVGRNIQDELRGQQRFMLELEAEAKKQIICSRTFGKPVNDFATLMETVANYSCNAAEKMRRQNSKCYKISVWAKTNPYKQTQQYYGSQEVFVVCPTSDSRKILKYTRGALEELYRQGYEYNKAGVSLSKMIDGHCVQMSLFERNDTPADDKLMQLIDGINRRDGAGTVKLASCGVDNRAWYMRQHHLSPRYVTGWSELPEARCL